MIGEVKKKQVTKKYVQFDSNFLETVFCCCYMYICISMCVYVYVLVYLERCNPKYFKKLSLSGSYLYIFKIFSSVFLNVLCFLQ